MPFLAHKPHHVRRSIVLGVTAGVAVIMLCLLVLVYTHKRQKEDIHQNSALGDFYTTIMDSAKSSPEAN